MLPEVRLVLLLIVVDNDALAVKVTVAAVATDELGFGVARDVGVVTMITPVPGVGVVAAIDLNVMYHCPKHTEIDKHKNGIVFWCCFP